MSLLDLRKKSPQSDKRLVSVDEFIQDAEHYAKGGLNNIVQLHPPKPAAKIPFRKATFTLSEECISALTQLAQETGLSKSALVRRLIAENNAEKKDKWGT